MGFKMEKVKYCHSCAKTGADLRGVQNEKNREFVKGYIIGWDETLKNCPYCKSPVDDVSITTEDFFDIREASNYNRQFLEAMIKLHDEDIIEYETKMAQLRVQANQIREAKEREREEEMKPKCPRCGSTSIATVNKGYSLFTGFLGSGTPINVCRVCGYKWKL